MTWSGWLFLSGGLLLACLISFSWAMRNFFSKPEGDNAGMKIIRLCGSAFAVLHLGAIILTPGATARQALAAATLYLCALGLFWWAIRANARHPLSAAFSPDSPVHIVEGGPYRFIRHPLYCSYLLTWMAGFVATGRLWLLPSVAVMLIVYVRAARMEEDKFSRSSLASAYEGYRSHTGMFLPNLIKSVTARKRTAASAGLAQDRV